MKKFDRPHQSDVRDYDKYHSKKKDHSKKNRDSRYKEHDDEKFNTKNWKLEQEDNWQ